MKMGLGSFLIFQVLALVPVFGEADIHSIRQLVNGFRGQEVSESEELQAIQTVYDQLEDLKIEEAKKLLTDISKELSIVLRHLEDVQDESAKASLRSRGRELLRVSMAIILRTPPWVSRIERWLDQNRKTYIILMEVFVVAAAILGSEMALKGESGFLWKFTATFAISLSSALVFVLPARYFRRISYEHRFSSLASVLLPEQARPLRSLVDLAHEIRYPSRLVRCRELLIYSIRKPKKGQE